ncbi:hypothetical protein V6N12_056530 [Hibiscus sabdariffa]|uniref:Uncharacterized protein n=1 Tax=Hibiscus sabdariffa TaxID=183260 RepID=A0ABR2CSS6_9ROSI
MNKSPVNLQHPRNRLASTSVLVFLAVNRNGNAAIGFAVVTATEDKRKTLDPPSPGTNAFPDTVIRLQVVRTDVLLI